MKGLLVRAAPACMTLALGIGGAPASPPIFVIHPPPDWMARGQGGAPRAA